MAPQPGDERRRKDRRGGKGERVTDQVGVADGVGDKQEGGLADHSRAQHADEEQQEEEELEGLGGHLEPVGGGLVNRLALPGHRLEHVPWLETADGAKNEKAVAGTTSQGEVRTDTAT